MLMPTPSGGALPHNSTLGETQQTRVQARCTRECAAATQRGYLAAFKIGRAYWLGCSHCTCSRARVPLGSTSKQPIPLILSNHRPSAAHTLLEMHHMCHCTVLPPYMQSCNAVCGHACRSVCTVINQHHLLLSLNQSAGSKELEPQHKAVNMHVPCKKLEPA